MEDLRTKVSLEPLGLVCSSTSEKLKDPQYPKVSASKPNRSSTTRWPSLDRLTLSARQKAHRASGIGGSDASIILSGNHAKILDLWREKRGEQPPPDLSDKLNVMLGSWTEHFNRQWYERLTGNRIARAGREFVSDEDPWRRCTLDGFVESSNAIWEAKHTSAFVTPDQLLERYMPQLQHNMAVLSANRAILSAIFGNHKFEIIEIASDWLYQEELLEAERHFWACVQNGHEPVAVKAPPPPKPVGTREVSFEGNNAWASAAVDWLRNRDAAKIHATSCGLIKSLIDDDIARAFGHGIEAKRSKSGAISIRELAR